MNEGGIGLTTKVDIVGLTKHTKVCSIYEQTDKHREEEDWV